MENRLALEEKNVAAGATAIVYSACYFMPACREYIEDRVRDLLGPLFAAGEPELGESGEVDGDGNRCREGELTQTGEVKTEPSTRKGNKGGINVQEGYKDSQGRDVTRQTVYDRNGKIVHGPHYRPKGFK